MPTIGPLRLLATIGIAVMFVAGCSSQATVSSSEVQTQISDALESQVGTEPDEVSCPEDMPAEVGETMRCELTHEDVTYGVTVEITEVQDDQALFDIEVDDQPSN